MLRGWFKSYQRRSSDDLGEPPALRGSRLQQLYVAGERYKGWDSVWTIIKGGLKLSLPTSNFSQ